ncbi:hypothetical protein CF392_07120 [Tamilnaduibacter salinus]|uniref:diguanylate cyclase n=1 Tax=Tamilnaduibacter salinus TaxID=1484056 RepID=A0A2A2I4D8_9GAMM|nr:GGDEF domain-containing protein [Tamilnaduibacter salinus]PAV26144.1 hypothetical protein CF392_07120 [Tamilnaduibacter salinus]
MGGPVLVYGVVFAACLLGIMSRPTGLLAVFWPANAILLGLFVRAPSLATWPGWAAALVGYVLADLSTGGEVLTTSWLTAANLFGVIVGFRIYCLLGSEHRRIGDPRSVLYLLVISTASAASGAVIGANVGPVFMDQSRWIGAVVWFTTELTHCMLILPLMLTLPGPGRLATAIESSFSRASVKKLVPVAVLGLSVLAAAGLGGPGAIAFPVPALLWCSLSYGISATVVLTLATTLFQLLFMIPEVPYAPGSQSHTLSMMSLRLGTVLLAVSPLTAATVNSLRRDTLRQLQHAANHDSLTGALVHGSFVEKAEALLSGEKRRSRGLAVMMLDIDHFKSINDQYGHAAGDEALVTVTELIRQNLRQGDLFGRLGGEEFGVVMPDVGRDQAQMAAERLRCLIRDAEVGGRKGGFRVTVSIGGAMEGPECSGSFEELLARADVSLYQAKHAGRNQTVFAAD